MRVLALCLRQVGGYAYSCDANTISGSLSDDWRAVEVQFEELARSCQPSAIVLERPEQSAGNQVVDLGAVRLRRSISAMARRLHAPIVELTPGEWSVLAAAHPDGLESDPVELVREMEFEPANDVEAAAICMTWAYRELVEPSGLMAV